MRGIVDALRGTLVPASPDPSLPEGVPAGVIVPLLEREEPRLMFTRRTDSVRYHKGEISFPGGARHAEDPDLLSTALRETEEELGIPAEAVEILGALPPTPTVVSGYVIRPFVGLLREPPAVRPSPAEIDEVLELELAKLAAAEREEGAERDGVFRTWFAYEIDGHLVWGATGRIVHALLEALRDGGWLAEAPVGMEEE